MNSSTRCTLTWAAKCPFERARLSRRGTSKGSRADRDSDSRPNQNHLSPTPHLRSPVPLFPPPPPPPPFRFVLRKVFADSCFGFSFCFFFRAYATGPFSRFFFLSCESLRFQHPCVCHCILFLFRSTARLPPPQCFFSPFRPTSKK